MIKISEKSIENVEIRNTAALTSFNFSQFFFLFIDDTCCLPILFLIRNQPTCVYPRKVFRCDLYPFPYKTYIKKERNLHTQKDREKGKKK